MVCLNIVVWLDKIGAILVGLMLLVLGFKYDFRTKGLIKLIKKTSFIIVTIWIIRFFVILIGLVFIVNGFIQ